MNRIKVGIIGTGFIGPIHIEALRRLGYVEVNALVAGNNLSLARKKTKQLNIPKVYNDYRRLLEDKEIEVVHNCTPNYLHFQINKDILESGKHIVSEKPLTVNSEDSEKLVELAKKIKLINAVNYNYRFYPLVQQIKQMISNGELGNIYSVHGSYLQDWLLYDTDYNWRIDSKLGGNTRAISDIGSHWCDLVQYVTGLKIEKVFGDLSTVHKTRKRFKQNIETFSNNKSKLNNFENIKISTEDYASVLLNFNNGAKGVFTVSQVSAGRKNRLYFEIDGTKKSVCWDQENPEKLWIGHRDKPNEILSRDPSLVSKKVKNYVNYPGGHPEGYLDALYNFMKSFYSDVKNNNLNNKNPDYATFLDGHNEVLLCESILESYKKQRWIEIIK
ncbi:MAG: dehydrogenase [Elusimicrobia bacterium RIFOXYD2_FULL_34_15]|nr:MAG: dehydrogenase [Elusimicrobia bacterium RIFOXYD2_FULL_34_15]